MKGGLTEMNLWRAMGQLLAGRSVAWVCPNEQKATDLRRRFCEILGKKQYVVEGNVVKCGDGRVEFVDVTADNKGSVEAMAKVEAKMRRVYTDDLSECVNDANRKQIKEYFAKIDSYPGLSFRNPFPVMDASGKVT